LCVLDVVAVELFFDVSPGSLPSASWMKITPHAAMNAATDQATVRFLIRWTRSRRAARGSGRPTRWSGRGGGGGGGGEGIVVMAGSSTPALKATCADAESCLSRIFSANSQVRPSLDRGSGSMLHAYELEVQLEA